MMPPQPGMPQQVTYAAPPTMYTAPPTTMQFVGQAPPTVMQAPPTVMQQGAPTNLFDALDRNHDGVLTREEFAGGFGTEAAGLPSGGIAVSGTGLSGNASS